MKCVCLFFLFLLFSTSEAQIITRVAGNGTVGYSGDGGPALNAELGDMYYTYPAFDNAGNMYIAQNGNNTIRKIDAAGIITTIAGTNGVIGYSGDGGPAVNALLYHPTAIAVDNANNIYFADRTGTIIRKIDPSGIITTVSGQYNINCGVGDGGPLALAQFNAISAIVTDPAGNLYISDYGCNTIRKVNTLGIVSTIAGNGTWGFSGDGGPATAAQLAYPCKVAADAAGNVYIPDAQNHRIRKVDPSGIITTIAGTGTLGYSGDGGQATLAQMSYPGSVVKDNNGNLFIGTYDYAIRKIDPGGIITTYVGNGTGGNSGDGGPATLAQISLTEGRISISNDNLYFVNYQPGDVIRKVTNCLTAAISQQPVNVTICNSGNAAFTIVAANVTSYQWQLNTGTGWTNLTDNGTYAGTGTNSLSVTGVSTGMNNYQYRCLVNNICGPVYSATGILVVNTPVPPIILITASSSSVCEGTPVSFTAAATNGGASPVYQWKKNGIAAGNNSALFTDNGLVNGDIITCTLISNANCIIGTTANSNAIVMTVTANVIPAVTISPSGNNICFGTPVTFTSSVTNGGLAPGYSWFKNNVNLLINTPTYTDNSLNNGDVIICSVHSDLSCITSQQVTSIPLIMTVNALITPSVTIAASAAAVCKNSPVTFTASPVNGGMAPVFQWKKNGLPVGNNSIIFSTNNLVSSDVITCTMIPAISCLTTPQVSSNAISLTVNPDPVVLLDKNSSLCEGAVRTLDAGVFSSYLWNTGSVNRTITVSGIGFYSVTVTDNNGCTGTGTANITQTLPSPGIFLPGDTNICSYGNLVINPTSGFRSYLWNTGSVTTSISVTQPGKYWLQVTDNNGCTGSDTVNVVPRECLKGFFMPTAFTPNNDGKNDILKPYMLGNVMKYQFSVYNRWGQIVFSSTDYSTGWNGKYKGEEQDGNIFAWVCIYQFEGEPLQSKKGTIVLIR